MLDPKVLGKDHQKASYRGQGLTAQRAVGAFYPQTPLNPSKTGRDLPVACPVFPPPVQEEAPETSLCGKRGGEGESCRAQYQGSDKLFSGEAGKGEV